MVPHPVTEEFAYVLFITSTYLWYHTSSSWTASVRSRLRPSHQSSQSERSYRTFSGLLWHTNNNNNNNQLLHCTNSLVSCQFSRTALHLILFDSQLFNTMPRRVRIKPPVSVVNVISFDEDNQCPRKSWREERNRKKRSAQERQRALLADIALGGAKSLAKGAVIFLSALAVYNVYPVARDAAAGRLSRVAKVHVPSDLGGENRRALTLNLGGGDCLWQVSDGSSLGNISCVHKLFIFHILSVLCSLLFMIFHQALISTRL